jgi:hypothetical protein
MQEGTSERHRLQRPKFSHSMITAEHLLNTDKNIIDNSHFSPNDLGNKSSQN